MDILIESTQSFEEYPIFEQIILTLFRVFKQGRFL